MSCRCDFPADARVRVEGKAAWRGGLLAFGPMPPDSVAPALLGCADLEAERASLADVVDVHSEVVLDARRHAQESYGRSEPGEEGYHTRPHWRRGRFTQRPGPKLSLSCCN